MGGWLPLPKFWPTNPNQIPIPPTHTEIPVTIDDLNILELAEMSALLRIACGRSQLPLKNPKRAVLCVLAGIIDYEIYHREHH